MRRPATYDYDGLRDFLLAGKNPMSHRKLGNNTYVIPCRMRSDPPRRQTLMGILYHETIIVAYYPNGDCLLDTGGWNTVTTLQRMNEYSPASVGSTKGKWEIRSDKRLGTTPPKVQKCRACKGTGQSSYENWWDYENGKHVRLETPKVTVHDCYRCAGTGQRDYGSKGIYPPFTDGIVVDKDGQVSHVDCGVVCRTIMDVTDPEERYSVSTTLPPLPRRRSRGEWRPEPPVRQAPPREAVLEGAYVVDTRNISTYTQPIYDEPGGDAMTMRFESAEEEAQAEIDAFNELIGEIRGR